MLELGCSPKGENCVQVSKEKDYLYEMRAELIRYKEMLQKRFPFISKISAYFSISWSQHDFGKYGEVVIKFPEEFWNIAEFVESNLPEYWNDEKVFFSEEEQ